MMRDKLIVWLLILCLLPLSGCFVNDASAQSETSSGEISQGNYVFVCPLVNNEYWLTFIQGIERADSELGTNTTVIGSKTGEDFETEIIQYMREAIDSNPDGIIVYSSIDALLPLIDEAASSGIPVVSVDSDAPETSRVAYVGTDLRELGRESGNAVVDLVSESAEIAYVCSSFSAQGEMTVYNSFLDSIHDYGITVTASAEGGTEIEYSADVTENLLNEHPEVDAVFCTGSINAAGAALAKERLGRDDLVIVGVDDIDENLECIREGTVDALLVQSPEQMGYRAVNVLYAYKLNGKLSSEHFYTDVILVNQQNIDTYKEASSNNLNTETGTSDLVRVGFYSGESDFQDGFSDDERKSGYAYEYYQEIAVLTDWRYEYVYGSRSEIMDMLIDGEVDIVAGVYKTDYLASQILFSECDMGLGGDPRYFAVSIEREDLLDKLNSAMNYLQQNYPDFTASLLQKYYTQFTGQWITDEETQWLNERGTLRFGYVRHNLPLSDEDENGQPTGFVKELIDIVGSFTWLTMEPVCYETVSDMQTGLSNGEIDIAFPVYSDPWFSEQNGFRQTTSFISDRVMVIYSGDYTEDLLDRVALSETAIGQQYYLAEYYSDSEIVYYSNRAEVIDAILRGDERCTVGSSSVLQRYIGENPKYLQSLNIAYLDTSENFCMAVSIDNNILVNILNKNISSIDNAAITNAIMRYSSVEYTPTLMETVQQYAGYIVMILFTFVAILLAVFVSYRKKVRMFNEEQLRSRDALKDALAVAERANEAKTVFLSSMSHDIRTPMNAIVGMATIAVNHMDDRDRTEDCLNKIILASHHLLTLINDILDVSKIESGKLSLNPVRFSLRDLIVGIINIARPTAAEKHIDLDIYADGLVYETVCADEVRLNQIFVNILSNAIKYTPGGGKVVAKLTEELLPDGNTARLQYQVKDTGIGMSETFMKNMYDVFSRVEDSRTAKIQGTGLGLAIVKRMVDLFGGTIECESEEGKGTKFTITLDLEVIKGKETTVSGDIRVLLADGDKDSLDTGGNTLRSLGITVDTAADTESALDIARSEYLNRHGRSMFIIDRKLLDTQIVQSLHTLMGADAHRILISAYDRSEVDGRLPDYCDFISKPLFRSSVCEKLNEMLLPDTAVSASNNTSDNELEGTHILVAEDNELNWEVISELLSMYGMTSERAENGQIVVDIMKSATPGKYDLILMDGQMPVLNGWETTKVLRACESEYIRTIPIIAMTADAFAEDVAKSMEVGMNGHVSKPVDMEILMREIKKVLKRQ